MITELLVPESGPVRVICGEVTIVSTGESAAITEKIIKPVPASEISIRPAIQRGESRRRIMVSATAPSAVSGGSRPRSAGNWR